MRPRGFGVGLAWAWSSGSSPSSSGAAGASGAFDLSAPAADIERWLKDSPGTREATPDSPSPGKRHFLIKPGGGAQHAEVNVDDEAGTVSIFVYWS